jgi:peroxiredoxin
MFGKINSITFVSVLIVAIFIGNAISGVAEKQNSMNDFTLLDYNGKEHSLSDYKDAEAIVVMFMATRCPVSNAYNSRMVELYDDYHPKGVAFLGIDSNKLEKREEIKEHAKEKGFQFPVLKDEKNVIADKFDAQRTPEIFVLNSDFSVLYHGRIDDSRREEEVTSHDLRNALDEILAKKPVSVKETKAFGCTIKKVEK